MRNSLRTKIDVIAHGMDFELDLFTRIPQAYYENTYGYCLTNQDVTRAHRFPQVLCLEDDLVVSVLRRPGSPWGLAFEDGALWLRHRDGGVETPVTLPAALPFFGKRLSDGTLTDDIISAYGAVTPGFFLHPDCFYFPDGTPCGFCSLRKARSSVARGLVTRFDRRRVMEATEVILTSGWDIPMITNTTGTPGDDETLRREVIEPLRAMRDVIGERDVKMHLLTHPPHDLDLLEAFKEAGVTSLALNLEVYDRDHFARVCPGKDAHYGYDRWWEALDHARAVFGDYQVYCGLVWGVEPVAASIEGMEAILARRIGLATNVFHADPGSVMARHPQPTPADLIRLAEAEARLYAAYPEAGTIYDVSMRNTIDWEVHAGYMSDRRTPAAPREMAHAGAH